MWNLTDESTQGLFPMALIACLLGSGSADAQTKSIGRWTVHSETNIVAVTSSNLGDGFAVRCLGGRLTLAVSEARTGYREGDIFEIEWRVDRKPTTKIKGIATSGGPIEIADQAVELIEQLPGARELTMKITNSASAQTLTFSLTNVTRAIAPVLKMCPLDLARADEGGPETVY